MKYIYYILLKSLLFFNIHSYAYCTKDKVNNNEIINIEYKKVKENKENKEKKEVKKIKENKKNKNKKYEKNKYKKDNMKEKGINLDITEYKIDESKFSDIFKEVNKVNEEDMVFIQSDTEGKVFNIISTLQIAKIIDINNPITVYYNFNNGKFEKEKSENSFELKLFEVNKNFKGTYIHLGDIVDRCTGNHQCIKSLLYLLYIKQELGDKVKLICGNHELTDYGHPLNPGSDCCKNIKHLITLIVFRAISNGQIKYLDKISIGTRTPDYILTHKVIYKQDIDQIKYFLKNKMKEKKDLKDCDIYDLIDVVNDNFKKYFTDFFNININNIVQIYEYSCFYDQLYNEILIGERVEKLGYNICLDNQICGHDHHEIDKCYIKDKNILFVDNYSFDLPTYTKPMVNIHFFNKNEELSNHKLFNIINDENNLAITIYNKSS